MRSFPKATLCSTLAIATALVAAPRPAAAQFIGTVNSQTGANAHVLGNGQLQINVTAPQAVINWTATGAPSGGVINFQQAGAVANFQGNGSFAVLNRVAPGVAGNAISINGTIQTSVNGQGGGGTVFFYSPNGIIIGQSAVIDVGSFGLTTSNILDDGNGNWLTGFGNGDMSVQFQPSLASGYVRIDPNATVAVAGQNNYIALVAPRIDVQGTIKTDGVAALVGAEAATLTIRDSGLWDIVVDSGTTDPQGISVTGSIKRNTAAVGNDHSAYLVSVAKNDAMTMLQFGAGTNLGFEIAGSAAVENNVVVLSAGRNVVNGAIADSGGSNSSIVLDGVNVSSNLIAGASNSIDIKSNSAGASFGGNVTLTADQIDVRATNNGVSIAGALTATADRGAASGDATGGDISVQAINGKSLNVGGATSLFARGYGAFAASGTAGGGSGGSIVVQAVNGGHLSFGGDLDARARGFGGNSGGGTAGVGHGGTVNLFSNGANSTINVSGATRLLADGFGGELACDGCTVIGGAGFGGTVNVSAASGSGNSVSLGAMTLTAQGQGGSGNAGGGEGRGGNASLSASDGSAIGVNGEFYEFADGGGGSADGSGNGGAGYGGNASLGGFGGGGGTITITGGGNPAHVTAEGFGGAGGVSGGDGGYAQGGFATVNSPGASINSTLRQIYVSAYGLGGAAIAGHGGNALGGAATLEVANAVNAGGGTLVQAFGQGGDGVTGGDGKGGDAAINVGAGTLASASSNTIHAYGVGGGSSGAGQAGGRGEGGHAALRNTGSTLSLGATTLTSHGQGGSAATGATGGIGGAAKGGQSEVYIGGGATTFTSTLTMNSNAIGGNGAGGGAATGGWSNIYGVGGTAKFNGAVTLSALANGGAGTNFAGGNAGGGRARLNTNGASYQLQSTLLLDTNVVGGGGTSGGVASGPYGEELNSAIIAGGGGSISVAGTATIRSNATGGNALAGGGGSGGAATAGVAAVNAGGETGNGSVDLATVNIDADATGGKGGGGGTSGAGGAGGAATGGVAQLYLSNTASGTNHIDADSANLSAVGTGGNGGAGGGGATGGNGGAGGAGTGGLVLAVAGAGNGQMILGQLGAYGYAFGGSGGNGGAGTTVGGSGGGGGVAQGGSTTIGINSGADTVTTAGTMTIASVIAFNDSYGGNGGNGGGGGTTAGNGGNGGNALGGFHQILARGGTLTIGSVLIPVDATGGLGGTGAVAGSSGIANTSDIYLIASERAGHPGTGASVDIGSYNVHTTAHPSGGAGTSIAGGGTQLRVENSSAHFGTYSSQVNATGGFDPASLPDPIRIIDGTVTVDGAMNVSTDNRMAVVLDGATLTAGSINFHGANFVHDAIYAPPASVGTITAGDVSITSGQDIVLDARLTSGGDINLDALGLIFLDDLNASGDINASAGSTITLGDIYSGNSTSLDADGTILAGDIDAGGDIDVQSDSGAITLGNLDAGNDIHLRSGGSMLVGDAIADGQIKFDSFGTMTGGDFTAGTRIDGNGDLGVVLGNLSAGFAHPEFIPDHGFSVGISSATSIRTGDIAAAHSIGFGTLGTLDTGTLTAGGDVLAMVGGDMNLGAINAGGRIFLTDVSSFILAGGGDEEEGDNFNPELVFGADPVATGGSITIDGTVSGESLQAAAGVDFTSDAITVDGLASILTGDAIDIGNITAGDIAFDAEGAILFGNAIAGNGIDFTSGGAVTGGNLTAGTEIGGGAEGAIKLGNLSAGLINPGSIDDGFSIELASATSINAGTVAGAESVGFATFGALTTGSITAGGDVLALAGGDMSFGAITAGADGRIYLGDGSMFIDAGGGDQGEGDTEFDPELVFAKVPVPTGGSITISGAISGGSLQAAAGTDFTAGTINVAGLLYVEAGEDIAAGNVHSGQSVDFTAGDFNVDTEGSILIGDVRSDGAINFTATGSVHGGDFTAGGNVGITTGDLIALDDVSSGGSVGLAAGTTIDVGAIRASGGGVTLVADGAINAKSIVAGGLPSLAFQSLEAPTYNIAINSGGAVTTGALDAGNDVQLAAVGNLTTGKIDAGNAVIALSDGVISLGAIDAGDLFYIGGTAIMESAGDIGDDFSLAALDLGETNASGGSATILGNINAGNMSAYSQGGVTSGNITTGFVFIGTDGAISIGDVTASDYADFAANGGSLTAGTIQAASLQASAQTDVTTLAITTGGGIAIDAGGNIVTGAWDAGWNADANADGSIAVGGTIDAGNNVALAAGTTLNTGDITAGGSVDANSGGAMLLGNIAAGDGGFQGQGIGTLESYTGDVTLQSDAALTTGSITATGNIALAGQGTVSTQAIDSGGYFVALGGSDMSFGLVMADGTAYFANASMAGSEFDPLDVLSSAPVASGGSITVGGALGAGALVANAGTGFTSGAITTGGGQWVQAGGAIAVGALDAGGDIDFAAATGPVTIGATRADGSVDIDSGGTLSGTTVSAGDDIGLWGEGGVTLTNLDAGITSPSEGGGQQITVGSTHDVSVGTLHAAGDIGLAAGGNLTAGASQAGGDMGALVGGSSVLGAATVGGRLGIGGYGLLAVGGGRDDFDKALVFAAFDNGTATATGGAVTIGALSASRFDAVVGTDFNAAGLNAGNAFASAGGTATITGPWSVAQAARVRSNDIVIANGGAISAGQSVTLQSTNAGGMFIGDGLTPTGYALSNGEFATLTAPVIIAENRSAAPTTTTVGNLSLTAPAQGARAYVLSVLDGSNRGVGKIRVVGNVAGSGFKANDTLAMKAGQIEIDAVNATIALQGAAGVLGGRLLFDTPRLYAASQAILDKLAIDPNYATRDYELQTAASSRPDSYISAAEIYVNLPSPPQQANAATTTTASPYSILVQNSGTPTTRAGFLANYVEIFSPEGMASGSIDLVVNGQIKTDTEVLTGAKARDAAMDGDDPGRFTSKSTINGCPVSGGPCTTLQPPPPPPPTYNPDPPLASQFQLFGNGTSDQLNFGNEETIEDNEEGGGEDSASSPITPPMPLFDTGSLDSADETDEPVSGGGNPALMGQCEDNKDKCEGVQ